MPYLNFSQDIDKHENHLPHWQQGDCPVFATWHLGDALPVEKRNQLRAERAEWHQTHPQPWTPETEAEYFERFSERVDKWLNAGNGACVLRNLDIAQIVADTLLFFEDQRYKMETFVVMPNHVHALFTPVAEHSLESILHSWKSFSAQKINKLLGRKGTLWMEDYWDRLIRSEGHFRRVVRYICENPQAAGLREGEYLLWVRCV
jgi:REP element-mobilizing transposase RayT